MKESINKFITISDFHDLTGFYSITLFSDVVELQGDNTPHNRKAAKEMEIKTFSLDQNGFFTGENGRIKVILK